MTAPRTIISQYGDAILALGGSPVIIYGNTAEEIEINWLGQTPIEMADIKVKVAELDAVYDTKKYQRDRQPEYPSIADQLDDIYHNGIDGWKATIKVTKDKYPKP